MNDVVWGDVVRVIDGDTFDLKVTGRAKRNRYEYNSVERIRIRSTDAPELYAPSGRRAAHQLRRMLEGEHVRCDIHARDPYGRLICDIEYD